MFLKKGAIDSKAGKWAIRPAVWGFENATLRSEHHDLIHLTTTD